MKKIIPILLVGMTFVFCGCNPKPQKVTGEFMRSLTEHDYDKAAACCGFSKDPDSKKIVIAVIQEQFYQDIQSYKITKDSILPDQEQAIVLVDINSNNVCEKDHVVHLKKMGRQWIVDPFVIEE